jgi:high-affinity nickel-transport protein
MRLLRILKPLDRVKVLPLPVIQIIGLLVVVNAVVWAAVGVVLHFHPTLISASVLSYTLGLRHALDADHISAIDLMTRRLIASGQRPVTVGTFFSLGHSTIVIVTCIVVAATSGALRDRFENFQYVGGIIGTSVSAAFLILLSLANGWILYRLVKRLRQALREPQSLDTPDPDEDGAAANLQFNSVGVMSRLLKTLFRIVDRPWKMYPLGILFGLGFDTSSEIAILGIASIQGAQGTSLWIILIFPLLFTCKSTDCKRVTGETDQNSGHVSRRYHGRRANDVFVHIKGICP